MPPLMRNVAAVVLLLLGAFLYVYLVMPVLNIGFAGLPLGIIVLSSLYLVLGFSRSKALTTGKKVAAAAFATAFAYLFFGIVFGTWALFRAEEYQNLLGEMRLGEDFSENVAPIKTDQIRIVDRATAYRLGDKVLGERPSLGSQAKLGDFNIQKVGERLFWVAPLLHSGFFKWAANSAGTPAYVMVSATNERDVRLVQTYNNEPVRIQYQPEGFFGDDLSGHVYFGGYTGLGLMDYTFEINDEGKPFWVVTLYDKEVGFSGRQTAGIVLVDAATGAMEAFTPEDAPLWIDRIQPEELVEDQLNWWGEYVHGYWNFSNEDKLETTEGMSLVYGKDNRAYWYTGITSVGNDEGTVGFVLVDTRTKEATWYRQAGATETAAMESAAGKVQEKGYVPSFPITYNINGVPTYVMALKDQAGLIKMAAMVNVNDYSIVGVGTTLQEALRSYRGALNSLGNALAPDTQANLRQLETVVERFGREIINGNTYYYLLLRDQPHRVFVATNGLTAELPVTQPGDSVVVRYDDTTGAVADLMYFENLSLGVRLSADEREAINYFRETRD